MADGGIYDYDDWDDDEREAAPFDDTGEDRGGGKKRILKIGGKKVLHFLKDLGIVLFIFFIIIGSLTLYAGNWPPVVVVESGSMMHDKTYSELGVIDTADMVIHKRVDPEDVEKDITTWVDHKDKHYGTYGDVIVFKKNGESGTPVLHRAVVWLEANLTNYDEEKGWGASYDVPSLGVGGIDSALIIFDYPAFALGDNSSSTVNIHIDIGGILHAYRMKNLTPESGFITRGDNNNAIDQPGLSLPIQREWVLGKAKGEVPWYGLVNLVVQRNPNPIPPNSYMGFFISLTLIVGTPFALDFAVRALWRKYKKKKTEKPSEARVISEEVEAKSIRRDEWDQMDGDGWDQMDGDGWDAWDEYEEPGDYPGGSAGAAAFYFDDEDEDHGFEDGYQTPPPPPPDGLATRSEYDRLYGRGPGIEGGRRRGGRGLRGGRGRGGRSGSRDDDGVARGYWDWYEKEVGGLEERGAVRGERWARDSYDDDDDYYGEDDDHYGGDDDYYGEDDDHYGGGDGYYGEDDDHYGGGDDYYGEDDDHYGGGDGYYDDSQDDGYFDDRAVGKRPRGGRRGRSQHMGRGGEPSRGGRRGDAHRRGRGDDRYPDPPPPPGQRRGGRPQRGGGPGSRTGGARRGGRAGGRRGYAGDRNRLDEDEDDYY